MTPTEYKDKILSELLNASSVEDAKNIIYKADNVINDSGISVSYKRQFWIDLYNGLTVNIALEEQAGSSLSAIIAAAQSIIAEKTSIQKN